MSAKQTRTGEAGLFQVHTRTKVAAVSNGGKRPQPRQRRLFGVLSQPDDVVKQGWLWKKHQKAQLWSGWHQRYFVLRRSASTLVYHRSTNITSKCRGKIELGTNSEIQFRGLKSATVHRRELYEFMVQCPTQSGSSMFMLGCVTQEEADSWLKAINDVAANSSKTVGTTSDINTLTDYEDSDFEEDDKTTGVEQSVGRTRLSTPGSSNRKTPLVCQKSLKNHSCTGEIPTHH